MHQHEAGVASVSQRDQAERPISEGLDSGSPPSSLGIVSDIKDL